MGVFSLNDRYKNLWRYMCFTINETGIYPGIYLDHTKIIQRICVLSYIGYAIL